MSGKFIVRRRFEISDNPVPRGMGEFVSRRRLLLIDDVIGNHLQVIDESDESGSVHDDLDPIAGPAIFETKDGESLPVLLEGSAVNLPERVNAQFGHENSPVVGDRTSTVAEAGKGGNAFPGGGRKP